MHEHDYVKDLRCPFIVDVQLCSCYDTKKIGTTGKALVQWVVEKPEGAPLPLEGQEKTWQKPIANYQGVNGYVEVLASYENGPPLGNTRFHVCYANPCTAMYDSKGKFGKKGPSYHGFYCGAQHVDPMFCPFDLEVPKTPSEAPPPLPETPGEAPLSPHETPGEATPKLSTAHVPASPPTPDPLLSPTFPAPLPDDEEDLPTEPAEAESLPIGMIGDRLLYATATPLDVEEEPATYATEKIESEDSEEDAAPLTAPAVPAPPLAVPALPPDASVGAVAVPPPIPPPPSWRHFGHQALLLLWLIWSGTSTLPRWRHALSHHRQRLHPLRWPPPARDTPSMFCSSEPDRFERLENTLATKRF